MYTKAIKPPAFIFIRPFESLRDHPSRASGTTLREPQGPPFESLRDRMNYSYLFSFANFFIKSTRAFTPSRVIAL